MATDQRHSAENDRPCCNEREPDGVLCDGTMRAGWPEFVCDTCRARCGAQVHPTHVIPPAVGEGSTDG